MYRDQKGFSALSVLLILVAIGLVGLAGWYVWHNQRSNISAQSTKSNDSVNNTQTGGEPLSLDSNKLPVGWTAEIKEPGRILLINKDSDCSTDALTTTDTAESNSPDINHNTQTVDAIKSKGYSVQEAQGMLTIVMSKGEKKLEAQTLQITGMDNPMSQQYAYIAKNDSYTQIQLSCPNNTELPTAQAALSAITFTEVD
ncbi:MAG: hypothetical protein JWP13_934 [Candidatus Saccharibacteria bacterium]|nr:hypothetical protein [Candidatus Saccharibacteria bacterium]